jgi:hypothetical protein
MAEPTSLRIRAYNVGFGDCFLLSFEYARLRNRHVLVDFGSTGLPKRSGPRNLKQVADRIRIDCDGKLDIVVATHRHADHISGFGGPPGEVIAGLEPDLVVQPWTEDPDLDPKATAPRATTTASGRGARRAVARLASMHAVAQLITDEVPRLRAAASVPRTVVDQLGFLGQANLPNLAAVRGLQQLSGKHLYSKFGARLPVSRILPGVKIDVLGPPTIAQSAAIKSQAKTDPDEFWHLAARTATARSATAAPLFPSARTEGRTPQEAKWVVPQVDRMQAEELLAIVRILDDAMNNTSLILLFEVGGTLLLFPGDAQIENWRYALHEAPQAHAIRGRLADTAVYKVGHHGSLNATPKKLLWETFERRDNKPSERRLISLLSTMGGKHGSRARGTEVPREPLQLALRASTTFVSTREDTTRKTFWRDVTLTF